MRLKLNRTLRAALIAAISTVGFTLPQTYATVKWTGGNSLNDWFYTANGKTDATLTDDEHGQVNITAEGNNAVTATITKVTVKDGATVRVSGSNSWGADRSFGALTINDITAGDGNGSVLLSTQPYTAGKPAQNTTVTVKSVTGTLSGVNNYGVLTMGTTGNSITTSGTIHNYSGATLTLCGGMSASDLTVDSTSTLKLANANLLTVSGNLTMAEGSIMDVSLISVSESPVVLATFNSATCNGVQVVGVQKGYDATLSTNGTQLLLTFTVIKPHVWKGTADNHNWNDAVWDEGVTFPTGTDADFTGEGHSEVSITSTVESGYVTVSGKDYTFNLSEQGSLSVTKELTVDGVKLSITGSGTVSASSINASGATIDVDGDATLTAGALSVSDNKQTTIQGGGTVSLTNLTLADGSTLAVAAKVTAGAAVLKSSGTPAVQVKNGGELTLSTSSTVDGQVIGTASEGKTHAFRKVFTGKAVAVENGGKLVIDGSMNIFDDGAGNATQKSGVVDLAITGSLKINANGACTWALGENDLTIGSDLWFSNSQNFTVAGGHVTVGGSLKLAHESNPKAGGYRATFTASNDSDVTLRDINFIGGKNVVTVDGSVLTFTKTGSNVLSQGNNCPDAAANFNNVNLNAATLKAVDNSWSLETITGTNVNIAGVTALDVGTNQTLTLSLDTLDGTFTKIGAGTATVNAIGSLTDTIKVNVGKLVLNGTYAIDNVASGSIEVSYIGTNGQPNENGGFYKQSGTKTVYTVATEDGAELDRTAAFFTYGGKTATVAQDGTFVIPGDGEPVFDTLYVKKNTLGFADHQAYAQQHGGSISTVQLADGTTVNMDQVATIGLALEDGASGTVNATAATTISSLTGTTAGATLTLSGSAVLTLNGDNSAFAGNVTINGGMVKIGNQKALGEYANQSKTITIAEGGTLDLNGTADANYTYTMDGGKLTNTGNALGTNLSQAVGMTLTKDSTVEALTDKQFWLRARGGNSTTLNLNGKTLVKTGAGTFGVFRSTVTAGTIEVQEGEFKFEEGGSVAADIILNGGIISGSISAVGEISLTAQQESTLNGLTVLAGQVDIIGTVNVSRDSLDLSSNNKSTGTIHVTDEGVLNVGSTLWMCSNSKIEVEDGGELNIAGLTITSSGEVVSLTSNGNLSYGTGNANFSISNATVTSTGDNVTLGNTLTDVSVVVADGSSLTLNSDADSVTVNGGGTFTLGEGKTVTNITVENGGTIAGGVDAKDVTIKAGATGTFVGGVSDIDNGVYIFGMDANPTIANKGEADAKYAGLQDENMKVTAKTLWSNTQGYTVKNDIAVESITHEGGELTLAHVDASSLDNVEVGGGSLVMQDITTAVISTMAIASGTSVAVYTDGQATTEGTVTITETLTAGGGTLLANLTMANGSTLDVNGGDTMALTLGSEFTIEDGALVTLDDVTLAAIADLENIGDKVVLLRAYTDGDGMRELTSNLTTGDWARTHFDLSSITGADYKLFLDGNEFSIQKVSNTPEPTTGTLSLLALAALAARRRRK